MKATIVKISIICLSIVFLWFGCQSNNTEQSQNNRNRQNRTSNNNSSTQQLEQEILEAARACGKEQERTYKNRIERQRKTHTEREFKQSLENMKKYIRC